jgi:tetratricopeptide (TPR) repeat protein
MAWFAGYATMVVAEGQRRKGEAAAALETYDRAIALFTRCAVENPPSRSNADHYVAIAQAGRARVLLERNDLDGSTRELLAAFATRPEATATMDGLNISAADTARMLRAALTTAQRTELLGTLDKALADLDPELLKLPAYEGQGPGQGPAPGARGGRRGGRRGN